MEVLDGLLDLIHLISHFILLFGVSAVSVGWGFSVLEHVEERVGIDSFHHGSCLSGLLMLLLLLDLLFGWVFTFKPLDSSSLDLLDLVFGLVLEGDREVGRLEEVILFGKLHLQG